MVKGTIYRIFNDNLNYIGSTIHTIHERLENHEISYGIWILNNFKKGYLSSFEVLKYKDYQIEEIDNMEVYFLKNGKYDKKELKKLEKFYINNANCVNIQFNKTKKKYDRDHSKYDLTYFIEKANNYYENKPIILNIN
jgi:hypothetical protein